MIIVYDDSVRLQGEEQETVNIMPFLMKHIYCRRMSRLTSSLPRYGAWQLAWQQRARRHVVWQLQELRAAQLIKLRIQALRVADV